MRNVEYACRIILNFTCQLYSAFRKLRRSLDNKLALFTAVGTKKLG